MRKYRFYVPYENARRINLPSDVAIDPFPSTLRELVEAVKAFYSLWYDLDWHKRDVVRLGSMPYQSSYHLEYAKKDMEIWLVVGSPTRGLILVGVNPETKSFLQTNAFTYPCYIFDISNARGCWFLAWKKNELEKTGVLKEIRAPRHRYRKGKREVIYVESREGIKHRVVIERKTRYRIDFTFYFEDENGLYKLSKKGVKELEDIANWIFREVERKHGKSWLPPITMTMGSTLFHITALPKDLFEQTIERLRDLTRRELQEVRI